MSKLSQLAESMVGSEIVKLGNEINQKIAAGAKINNFTIGDFAPAQFPIPDALRDEIIKAYTENRTNYPPAMGILPLRKAVSHFIERYEGVTYAPEQEILIASGGRPLIYAIFRTLVDAGDKVIYAVPSWNNNHYTNMTQGQHCVITTDAAHGFMPTAADIAPHISGATLLCLCSPQNPTGTTMSESELQKIAQLVIEENERRAADEKKLYIMYDQMYFTLTYGDTQHYNPVSIAPALRPYTILLDGISKAFAATGVRVGWAMGPAQIIAKMSAILSHIGAWAPMAEQHATARFLVDDSAVASFMASFKEQISQRLHYIYDQMMALKRDYDFVDVIAPQAAIYLTVKFDLVGKKYLGAPLQTQQDVTNFLIDQASLAIVPFNCFGAAATSPWYRISVGTASMDTLSTVFNQLADALSRLED